MEIPCSLSYPGKRATFVFSFSGDSRRDLDKGGEGDFRRWGDERSLCLLVVALICGALRRPRPREQKGQEERALSMPHARTRRCTRRESPLCRSRGILMGIFCCSLVLLVFPPLQTALGSPRDVCQEARRAFSWLRPLPEVGRARRVPLLRLPGRGLPRLDNHLHRPLPGSARRRGQQVLCGDSQPPGKRALLRRRQQAADGPPAMVEQGGALLDHGGEARQARGHLSMVKVSKIEIT